MDHAQAVRSQLLEKYLLGDLKGKGLEEFEEHFFECALCAEEIQVATLLADNAAAELKLRPARETGLSTGKSKSGWQQWFQIEWGQPAMVMPLLALVVVSGLWVRDHEKLAGELAQAMAPQSFATVALENTRGSGPASVTRSGRFFAVEFYVEPASQFEEYNIEISGNGIESATVIASRPAPGSSFNVLLPVARFKAGRYEFLVHGGSRSTGPVLKKFTLNLG